MRKVQNCNALTHKHTKDTIAFTFNEIKRLLGGSTSENLKKKSKTGYISNRSALLRAARMSRKAKNCKDLGFAELLLYFSVKIEWHSKNYSEIILF